MTTLSSSSSKEFQFPPHHTFPPFYTLQPIQSTRKSQLATWSSIIQSYCAHNRIFTLSLSATLSTPLFNNTSISRHLSAPDARSIINYMTTPEAGQRAEWIPDNPSTTSQTSNLIKKPNKPEAEENSTADKVFIFWKRPEEWAGVIEEYIERTGQKNTVLTLYEIVEGEATKGEEFYGMDIGLLKRCLGVCVKRGKAQVFSTGGGGEEMGVKFF